MPFGRLGDLDEHSLDERAHKVEIIQRERIHIQGVSHVESFDDRQIVVETDMGVLSLTGEDFHITSLDLERGEMMVEGMILALEYSSTDRSKARSKERGFLQRIFR